MFTSCEVIALNALVPGSDETEMYFVFQMEDRTSLFCLFVLQFGVFNVKLKGKK